jgi:DNA-binding transcriptional regulator WhiA
MSDIDVLAGIIGSDGHIYKDKYSLCVVNKNEEFIEKTVIPLIQKLTGKKKKSKFVSSGYGDGKFKVHVSSVKFCRKLIEEFNIPAGAKSETIEPPNLSDNNRRIDYLRGWIAGDGSVTNDRTRVKIEIWSKSKVMLEWFSDILQENGIRSRMFEERMKKEFILRIGRKDDVKSFYKTIKIPHSEKQNKLEDLLSKTSRSLSN